MFRYSGPLLSFVVIAVCLGVNIVRYPAVWEMVDQTAFAVRTATQEQEIEEYAEYQIAQTETEITTYLSKEGTPVPPPLGGSPSSVSSTRTAFTTNLSKSPPENVSSSGYEPIPVYSVPNHRIANLVSPPKVEEDEPGAEWIATNESEWVEEDVEEDLSGYQPILSQPIYTTRYEEQLPELEKTSETPNEESRELTPEEKVEAFKNSPLDLVSVNVSDNELSERPEWW